MQQFKFLSAAAALAAGAVSAQVPVPHQRVSDLRAAVQQKKAAPAANPHSLTAQQLAELRRQVQQQSRVPAKQ